MTEKITAETVIANATSEQAAIGNGESAVIAELTAVPVEATPADMNAQSVDLNKEDISFSHDILSEINNDSMAKTLQVILHYKYLLKYIILLFILC